MSEYITENCADLFNAVVILTKRELECTDRQLQVRYHIPPARIAEVRYDAEQFWDWLLCNYTCLID